MKIELKNIKEVHYNYCTPKLYEHAVKNNEGIITHLGPFLVSKNGSRTSRSPDDKFIVKDKNTADKINWGEINKPYDAEKFECLFERVKAYLQNREIYVQDAYSGAGNRVPIRVISEFAWQSLFARNMLFRIREKNNIDSFNPDFTVIAVPNFLGDPEIDGINSEAFIIINITEKVILIAGTHAACEIKKAIFTVLNYIMPQKEVLPMHCSANVGSGGDTALFFGLSGTGKTTLSASQNRNLIGDDEHGWDDEGIFNFEGGCYAKVINLSRHDEPEIYETTRKFGTILENVAVDSNARYIDLNDSSITENTRAAYPLTHINNIVKDSKGGHPENIFFLTADAFGVLPPISKLSHKQAVDYFLLGYTAKVPGSEEGIAEPVATFSSCFGAPFMPLHLSEYAKLLSKKIKEHNVKCWLINTGWIGGSYGVGERIAIKYTRAMLNAAIEGKLDKVEYTTDPFFCLEIPQHCTGVPEEVLIPGWNDKRGYEKKAKKLSGEFKKILHGGLIDE